MAIDDVAPREAEQRRAVAWATIKESESMAVPDPDALTAELEGVRGRGLPGPESMRHLSNEGRRD